MNHLKNIPQTYMGMKVIVDDNLTETVEDWSKVRSPSRAKRRMKRGFSQNVVYRKIPSDKIIVMNEPLWGSLSPSKASGVIYMHSEKFRQLVLKSKEYN